MTKFCKSFSELTSLKGGSYESFDNKTLFYFKEVK
jgi:hypothetical protein